MGEAGQNPCIRFGVFELSPESGELRKAGARVKVQEQPLKILLALVERPGELVTREELKRRIGPEDSFGDFDHAVNIAVGKLRAVLADSADTPRFIETLPRRGYRFIYPIAPRTDPEAAVAADAASTERAETAKKRLLPVLAVVAAGLALAVSAGWFLSRNRHVLTEKDTIVLSDFTNKTGDTIFDDTMKQALTAALGQSPFLNILSDQRARETLRLMDRPEDERITPEIAREICGRTGSTAVLDGSIASLGSRYAISLNATNCATGDLLASEEVQAARREGVLDALGNAAVSMRGKLGESMASIQRFETPLTDATTSSFGALKAFDAAERTGDLSLFQHAVELDPRFALAYCALSDYYADSGEGALAAQYAQKAFDLRDRASERERFRIVTTYYFAVLGDLNRELQTYPAWERMYPRDGVPWINSSASRLAIGDYSGALREAQEGMRLVPDQESPYMDAAVALVALDRRAEAKQVMQQARARGVNRPDFSILLYRIAFVENETDEMQAQLAPFLTKPDEGAFDALWVQSDTEAYFGRRRNSLKLSGQAFERVLAGKHNEVAAQVRSGEAAREAEFGNFDKARRAADAALTLSSGRWVKTAAALALARAGDVKRAEALADELNRRFPADTLLQRFWLPAIRGSIALDQKNPAQALHQLESVSYELGRNGPFVGDMYAVYVHGEAYLASGQGKEAAGEFQKFAEHRSIVANSPLGALAHLGLGRAYAVEGDKTKARGAYQDFLTLWKDADPDIPVLKQAKTEYGRLQ
jgi:eukaryotic-like serine/threonine-protein kinase